MSSWRLFRPACRVLALLAMGCSGGEAGSNPPPTTSLTVEPTEWSVPAGGAPKQFTATLTGSTDPIAWSIETADTAAEVGALSATGLYTPPPSLAIGRDVVLKATAGTLVARATVHVGAAVDGVTITVTPATGSVVAGSGQTVALHAATNHAGTVAWTLVPDLGTLDATSGPDVTYTAPANLVTATTDVTVTAAAGAVSDGTVVTVQPTVLAVTGPATVRAGGPPVAFVLVTSVGASTVAWSVSPSSAGTISGASSVGTFTPASSAAADTPFQVVATVGEATGSASSTLLHETPTPGSVTGRVVDERGIGYAGAKVVLGSSVATTGADGAFTIASVGAPYDVTVIAESNRNVTVFRGVSTMTPVLPFTRSILDPLRSVTVSGIVTYAPPGQTPVPIGAMVFGPVNRVTSSYVDGSYSFPSQWMGATTATLTHRSVYVSRSTTTHFADGYLYGSTTATATDGGTVTGQDIALGYPTQGDVSGSAVAGYDVDLSTYVFSVGGYFDDGTSRSLDTYTAYDTYMPPYGTFTITVPVLPDGSVRLGARASGTAGGSTNASAPVTPGQTGVSLVMPRIPTPVAPADGTPSVGYATPFTWDTLEIGGTDSLDVDCNNGVSYRIWGGGRSATIPDLGSYGVTMGFTGCTWYPRWVSYSVADLVQGPAAVDALAVKRTASGVQRSFVF